MTDRTISPPGSPLRRPMTEDMTVRGFTASTQRGYLVAVENFTAVLGRAPDRSDAEDLRRYQLHMRSNGASVTGMNAAVSAACRPRASPNRSSSSERAQARGFRAAPGYPEIPGPHLPSVAAR